LTGLGAVHLSFLEDLIVLRICSLADILDAPGEAVLKRLQRLEEDFKRDLV